jgi:hypothetical protein
MAATARANSDPRSSRTIDPLMVMKKLDSREGRLRWPGQRG